MNIFLLDDDASADYAPPLISDGGSSAAAATTAVSGASTGAALSDAAPESTPKAAEIMVMIAEPAYRRKGYAREAVVAMLQYAYRELGIRRFVAKITDSNQASLNLFQQKLGFQIVKVMAHFNEIHLARDVANVDELGTPIVMKQLLSTEGGQ